MYLLFISAIILVTVCSLVVVVTGTKMTFVIFLIVLLSFSHLTEPTMDVSQLDIFDIIPIFKVGARIIFNEHRNFRKVRMWFDPEEAQRDSNFFQRFHGYRGKSLIQALGAGLPLSELQRIGAV